MADQNPRLFSAQELASIKGVSLVAVNRQIKLGKLRASRVGRVWAVFEDDAREWLDQYEPQRYEDD